MVYLLQGGPSKLVQKHLSGLFNSIASFYHPSNNGRWLVSSLHVKTITLAVILTVKPVTSNMLIDALCASAAGLSVGWIYIEASFSRCDCTVIQIILLLDIRTTANAGILQMSNPDAVQKPKLDI